MPGLAATDGVLVRVPALLAVQPKRRLVGKAKGSAHPEFSSVLETADSAHQEAGVPPCLDPASRLAAHMAAEADLAAMHCAVLLTATSGGGRARCPMCPWYEFSGGGADSMGHLETDHGPVNTYVASGTKQLRLCMALFETDQAVGRHPGSYLSRSAELLREAVHPSPPSRQKNIDKFIRVILDDMGPRVCSQTETAAVAGLRRVGNVLFTRGFAEKLLRELLLSKGSLPEALNRLQCHFLLGGNALGSLLPVHSKTMWAVIADILDCKPLRVWDEALFDAASRVGEFQCIALDGTMKIAMGLMGYPRRQSAGPSAWEPEESISRVLTMRGLSGFVIGTPLVRDESALAIRAAMEGSLVEQRYRDMVEFVVADRCTAELDHNLRQSLKNLRCVCLDPIHLVMRVKAATGHRPSAVSARLSSIMAKFGARASALPSGWPWTWGPRPSVTAFESTLLRHLERRDLPGHLLVASERRLAEPGPWVRYADYLTSMAALATMFPDFMQRKTKAGRGGTRVGNVLRSACEYSKWACYANNVYMRTSLSPENSAICATGTTGNEALHAELRSALRQVYRVHAPTLRLRLHLLSLAKRIGWEAARRVPALRQQRQLSVLCRVLARPLLDADSWESSASGERAAGARGVRKSCTASDQTRRLHVTRVRQWLKLKATGPAPKRRKRTVFSLRRRTHLTGGGATWGRRFGVQA